MNGGIAMNDSKSKFVKIFRISIIAVIGLVMFLFLFYAFKAYAAVETGTPSEPAISKLSDKVVSYGFIAAAAVVGLGSVGAGIAVGYVGAAAIGAISEKPDLFGRALIFVALAEGIAIYGVIIAIMILSRLG